MRIPAHSVCTAIRDDIVSGVHPRGGRLTEEVLARRYGVSRVPVREALRTLEAEGFVVTRRHAGACVAEPGEREAADLLEMRVLLEPLGAERAAARRTDAHLKVLQGMVTLAHERLARGRGEDVGPLGEWFHQTLAQAADSPGLTSLLSQLRHKVAWMYPAGPSPRPAELWAEHGAISDAVTRRDPERARALMARHAERAAAGCVPHFSRVSTGGAPPAPVSVSQPAVNTTGPRR